jgi:hypothetical protein
MGELWVVCMKRPDGSFHIENLVAVDEAHAKTEAEALWCDFAEDEICVAVKLQAELGTSL